MWIFSVLFEINFKITILPNNSYLIVALYLNIAEFFCVLILCSHLLPILKDSNVREMIRASITGVSDHFAL